MILTKPSIRLIALPLSKRSNTLIYFYAQQLPSLADQKSSETGLPSHASFNLSPSSLIKKMTDTGTKQWNKLANSAQGSWKLKIYYATRYDY